MTDKIWNVVKSNNNHERDKKSVTYVVQSVRNFGFYGATSDSFNQNKEKPPAIKSRKRNEVYDSEIYRNESGKRN